LKTFKPSRPSRGWIEYNIGKTGHVNKLQMIAPTTDPILAAHEAGHIPQAMRSERQLKKVYKFMNRHPKVFGKLNKRKILFELEGLKSGRLARTEGAYRTVGALAAVPLITDNEHVQKVALLGAGAIGAGSVVPMLSQEIGADIRGKKILNKLKIKPRKGQRLYNTIMRATYLHTALPFAVGGALMASAYKRKKNGTKSKKRR
jgi:hypothetical protein